MVARSSKTIVYQSFRTHNVPNWVQVCLNSVKEWAEYHNYEYLFIDDSFFELAPNWYREKVEGDILLTTDLARLIKAEQLLKQGYERTIWIDADVIISNPREFKIDSNIKQFAFCFENWFNLNHKKEVVLTRNINNSLTVFKQGNSFLTYYIDCCKTIVKTQKELKKTSVGTEFLSQLYQLCPFHLLRNVGLFSPFFMILFLKDENESQKLIDKYYPQKMYAINLCHSFRNTMYKNIELNDELYMKTILKLQEQHKVQI